MKVIMRTVVAAWIAVSVSAVLAGRLPDGYRELGYVESHGTEWFDTGVVPDAGTVCTVDVTPLNEVLQSRVVTARNCPYADMCGYLYFEVYVNGYGQWSCALQDDTGNWGPQLAAPVYVRVGKRVRLTLDADRAVFSVGDRSGRINNNARANRGQCAIRFMTPGSQEGDLAQPAFVGRLHAASIVQDGVLVRDFVPCRRESDGAVGLYDVAPHEGEDSYVRFYEHSGTGNLVAGMAMDVADGKASVAFPPAERSRTLYLAYGNADGGDCTNGWQHVVEAATVPAGVDHVDDITLPAGLGTDYFYVRAFLEFDAVEREMYLRTTRDYVQDGLFAQWDGAENGGVGIHKADAQSPRELKGAPLQDLSRVGGAMAPVDAKSFRFGLGHLAFKSGTLTNAVNAGTLTIEMTLAENGAFNHNGGLITIGTGTRGFWLYQQKSAQYDGMISAYSYHAVASGEFTYLGLSKYGTPGVHTYSFVLGDSTANSFYATNGVYGGAVNRHSTDVSGDGCCLGSYSGGVRPNAKVYSVRIYTRRLSQQEVADNAAIDEIRFREKVFDSSETWNRGLVATKIESRKGTLDIVLPPAAYQQILGLAWSEQDEGDALAAWTNVVNLCEIPAGVSATNGIVVPEAVRKSLNHPGGFRLFLTRSAHAYVQRGLYAQWDGIENAGYGVHDATLSYPRELTGTIAAPGIVGTLPTSGGNAFLFGSGYLSFQSSELQAAVNAGTATVEFVLEENGTFVHNSGLVSIGLNTRGFWTYQQNQNGWDGMVSAYSYHAKQSGEYSPVGLSPQGTQGIHTYAFVLGDSSDTSFCAQNGVRILGVARYATDATDSSCYIGCYPTSTSLRPHAKVYSIRLYTQCLTAEEVAANAEVDTARFRNSARVASDFYPTSAAGLVVIVR